MDFMENGRNTNGTFKPGHDGFKPRGSVNEFQKVTREKLGEFLKEKLDDLPAIYDELKAQDKARLLLMTVEFFLPKQRELMITDEEEGIDLTLLPGPLLKQVLKALDHGRNNN